MSEYVPLSEYFFFPILGRRRRPLNASSKDSVKWTFWRTLLNWNCFDNYFRCVRNAKFLGFFNVLYPLHFKKHNMKICTYLLRFPTKLFQLAWIFYQSLVFLVMDYYSVIYVQIKHNFRSGNKNHNGFCFIFLILTRQIHFYMESDPQ